MIKKTFIYTVILFLFNISCIKKENNKKDFVLDAVQHTIDSMHSSHSNNYDDYLFTIAHQKKDMKNYLKISTANFFNEDSVTLLQEYKGHILVFYSNDLFHENINGLNKYLGFVYKENTVTMYHPRYVVIEILNNKYRRLSFDEQNEKKLFLYGDIPDIPEPFY